MQQLHRDLRAVSETDTSLPPDLRARILTQLDEAADRTPPPVQPARPWLVRYGFAASLAVNAALLIVLVYTGLLRETRTDQVSAPPSRPAASPPSVQDLQDSPRAGANKRLPHPGASKPVQHVVAHTFATNNAITPAGAQPTFLTPKAAPRHSVTAPPPAVTLPAPVFYAHPVAGTQFSNGAANRTERPRSKTAPEPLGLATDGLTPAAPAPPVTTMPSVNMRAGGFGGGGFGGAAGNGVSRFSPAPQEATPGGTAPGPAPPPAVPSSPPLQTPPKPADVQQDIAAGSADTVAAKPARPSAKALARDRDTPAPVGSWPTVTLPFGLDPNTLGVKSVAVTWDVDEQGDVSHVLFTTTGDEQLNGAIRSAIYAGRYEPATRHGRPIKARLSHTFIFAAPKP